jgi:hypothetical protein
MQTKSGRQKPVATLVDARRDDLVSALRQLTVEIERFDSLIEKQRRLLEGQLTGLGGVDDDRLLRESTRISESAQEIVAGARGVLEHLRQIGEGPAPS